MKLSKPQLELVTNLERDFYNKSNAIVGWYTGSGKTTVISELLKLLLEKNPKIKIGFSAHFYISLKEQVTSVLGRKHEVSNDPLSDSNIIVFNPQSVYRRDDVKFDLLIVDEAHEGLSEQSIMLRSIIKRSKVVFALSATPWELIKMFPKYKVYTRGLIDGVSDGRVGDFRYKLHEYDGRIEYGDVDGNGEIRAKYLKKNKSLLVKFQKEKLVKLSNSGELGDKVLVIVPSSEFSYPLHETTRKSLILDQNSINEEEILIAFKKDPNIRYLIVVRKCGVGFDMPELTDVVDLTMTRNLKQIVQRMGRVTRKYHVDKRYHYVYDKRMTLRTASFYMDYAMDLANGDEYQLPKNRKQIVVLGKDGNFASEMSFKDYILSRSSLENVATVGIEDYKNTGDSKEDILEWIKDKNWIKDKEWKDAIKNGDVEAKRKRKRATKLGEIVNINNEYFLSDEMLFKRIQVAKNNKPNGAIKEMAKIDNEGLEEIKERGLLPKFYPQSIAIPVSKWTESMVIEHVLTNSSSNSELKNSGGRNSTVYERAKELGILGKIENLRLTNDNILATAMRFNCEEAFEKSHPRYLRLAKERGLNLQYKENESSQYISSQIADSIRRKLEIAVHKGIISRKEKERISGWKKTGIHSDVVQKYHSLPSKSEFNGRRIGSGRRSQVDHPIVEGGETKKCTKCLDTKSILNFSFKSIASGRRESACKSCLSRRTEKKRKALTSS